MKNKIKFSVVIALAPWRDAEIIESINAANYDKSKIEVIIEKGLNVPINRNNGVAKSKGEFVIFLDDDGKIDKDFFNKVEDFVNQYPQVDIFGGPQITPEDDSYFAKVNRYLMAEAFVCPGINNRYKRNPVSLNANSNFLSGALFICRRSIFEKLSFDPKQYPADEVNFIDKAKALGFKVGYTPEIFIYHHGRKDIKGYLKQIYFFGNSRSRKEGALSIFQKPLFFVPAVFTIYLVFLALFVLLGSFLNVSSFFIILFSFPFLLYVLFAIFTSLKISIQNKHSAAFLLSPFLMFLTHVSYGLGFISGILNKEQKEGI